MGKHRKYRYGICHGVNLFSILITFLIQISLPQIFLGDDNEFVNLIVNLGISSIISYLITYLGISSIIAHAIAYFSASIMHWHDTSEN